MRIVVLVNNDRVLGTYEHDLFKTDLPSISRSTLESKKEEGQNRKNFISLKRGKKARNDLYNSSHFPS